MRNRVEKEIGEHLSVWSGVAVHREIGLAFDVQDQIVLSQRRFGGVTRGEEAQQC